MVTELLDRAFAPTTEPRDIVEDIYPEIHRNVLPHFRAVAATSIRYGLRVHGDGGGAWWVEMGVDDMRVGGPLDGAAGLLLTAEVARDTWETGRSFLESVRDLIEERLEDPPPRLPKKIDAQRIQMLQMLRGTMRLVVLRPRKESWEARIHLAGGSGSGTSQVTVTLSVEDLEDLIAGTLEPADAIAERRIRLEGDMGIFAQIGLALAPVFSRR